MAMGQGMGDFDVSRAFSSLQIVPLAGWAAFALPEYGKGGSSFRNMKGGSPTGSRAVSGHSSCSTLLPQRVQQSKSLARGFTYGDLDSSYIFNTPPHLQFRFIIYSSTRL